MGDTSSAPKGKKKKTFHYKIPIDVKMTKKSSHDCDSSRASTLGNLVIHRQF